MLIKIFTLCGVSSGMLAAFLETDRHLLGVWSDNTVRLAKRAPMILCVQQGCL